MDNKNNKKRIIKDYDALPEETISRIKMQYPRGFAQHLVSYVNKEGKKVSALPFETEDIYYLVRMTVQEAKQIIEDDEDYDDDGVLRDDFSVDVPDNEDSSSYDDESYFRSSSSVVDADGEYSDSGYKSGMSKTSEYADSDLSDIKFDDDEDEDTAADDDDDEDDDDDDTADSGSGADDDDDDEDDDLDFDNLEVDDEFDGDGFKSFSKGDNNRKKK